MPLVKLKPDKEHPVPYDLSEEKPTGILEEMAVAGNTVELQVALGAPLETTQENADKEKALLDRVIAEHNPENLKQPSTAFAAAAFLRTYGATMALDAAQARCALTNKLMEIANCGDIRHELKAIELLGKHSDIGLFTERSELTINYKDPADLENAIKERVKRLLNASLVDVKGIGEDLDGQLGVAKDISGGLMAELESAHDEDEEEVVLVEDWGEPETGEEEAA